MKRTLCLTVLGVLFAAAQGMTAPSPDPADGRNGVSPARFSRMTRGKNVFWFQKSGPPSASEVRRLINEDRAKGYRSWRLVFEYPRARRESYLTDNVDWVLEICMEEKWGVILDPCHYYFGGGNVLPDFDSDIYSDIDDFWAHFAERMSRFDPEYLFLEVFNEPYPQDPGDWVTKQRHLAKIIRQNAPDHTIVGANSLQVFGDWNATRAMVEYDYNYPDVDNMVHGWHMYYPMEFTHQCADWIGNPPKTSWPGRWGRDWLWENHIKKVVEWCERENVYAVTDEWGTYDGCADPEDMRAYVYDLIDLLDDNQIGWLYWFPVEQVEDGFDLQGELAIDNVTGEPEAPAITTQPESITVDEGRRALFSVEATGYPRTYQWYIDDQPVDSSDAPRLQLDNVTADLDGASIRVTVSNELGSVTSETVTLTVVPFAGPVLPKSGDAPVVDGAEDALWQSAVALSIENVVLGSAPSQADLSATWKALYDEQNLYLLIAVTDDVLDASSTGSDYENDGVEVYLDSDNSKGTSYGADDFQYRFTLDSDAVFERDGRSEGIAFAQEKTASGYRIEIAIPLATLGMEPTASLIGLDVHVNDNDGGGRENKIAWYATADDSWQDPSTFGVAKLGTAGLTALRSRTRQADLSFRLCRAGSRLEIHIGRAGPVAVRLMGIDGRVAAEQKVTDGRAALSTDGLSAGCYVLTLVDADRSIGQPRVVTIRR